MLSDDRGFTVIELLVAIVIGTIVVGTAGTFFVATSRSTAQVADRVESTARARLAVDRVVRDLQAQVCLSASIPPLSAASATSATFTADLAGTGGPPSLVTVAYDPATRRLTRSVRAGTGEAPATTWTSPATTDVLLADAGPAPGVAVLRYFAYRTTAPSLATVELTAPLSAADRARVVRVDVTLRAAPQRTHLDDPRGATVTDDAWVGTADGDVAARGPGC